MSKKLKSELAINFFGEGVEVDMVPRKDLTSFLESLYKISKNNLNSQVAFVVSEFAKGKNHTSYLTQVLNCVRSDVLLVQNELRKRVKNYE